MDSASRLWMQKCDSENMPHSNFMVGPCKASVVTCTHVLLDENGHCEICCGSGWVTRAVAEKFEMEIIEIP